MNLRAQLTPDKKPMKSGTHCRMKDYPEQEWKIGKFISMTNLKGLPYNCVLEQAYKDKIIYSTTTRMYKICEEIIKD